MYMVKHLVYSIRVFRDFSAFSISELAQGLFEARAMYVWVLVPWSIWTWLIDVCVNRRNSGIYTG